MTPGWKLDRVRALNDEVKEVHPMLAELFRRMSNITEVKYTQGNREYGADFVLTKRDEVLLDEDYVGVIVKSISIKQDHEDVSRQIEECEFPRPVAGAKKSVIINEIWVITSKDITRNAQDFIHHKYKSKKVKFFDAEKLVLLLDRLYPEFWEYSSVRMNKYITSQKESIKRSEGQHNLLPHSLGRLEIPCQVIKSAGRRTFGRTKNKPTTLLEAIKRNRFIFLEGGMGAGKSELLRSTAASLCEEDKIEELNSVPHHISYRELKESKQSITETLDEIVLQLGEPKRTVVFFIDGFDETSEEISIKAETICAIAQNISSYDNAKLVVASRPILEENESSKINKHFDSYVICPLSYGSIISVVEQLCKDYKVSNKFRSDLQNSPLMKALPRTPLSAILLGRLLAENIKELPSTLPELYSKYTDLVLGRWDIQKGNGSEKEYETIQRITAVVAAYMLENDLQFLGKNELSSIFKEYLGKRRTGQNAEALLEGFLKRQEIIGYSDTRCAVFFKHKSFMEFFYATMQFQQKGVEAPINKPFDPYWQGAEYFYLGLVKDAPNRLETLSKITPQNDLEFFLKMSGLGQFMLAAYQTPYSQIEYALNYAFKDAAKLYTDIVYNGQESWLRALPELQFLCLMTTTLRKTYAYEFFLPALHEAKIQAEMDTGLSVEERNVLIFFVDAVLAALGDESAFIKLGEQYDNSLDWVLRVGIREAADDVGLINVITKKMEKRLSKAAKGNLGFQEYLRDVQQKPMLQRKTITH